MEQQQPTPDIPAVPTEKFHGYSYLDQKYVEEYNNFGVPSEFSRLNDGNHFIVPVSYAISMFPFLYDKYMGLFIKQMETKSVVYNVKSQPSTASQAGVIQGYFSQALIRTLAEAVGDDIKKTISSFYVANYYKELAIKNSGGVVSPSIRGYMDTVTKDNSEKNLNLEKLWAEYQTTCFKDPKRALQMYNLFNATNMDMNEANPLILEVALNNPPYNKFDNKVPFSINATNYYDWLHTTYVNKITENNPVNTFTGSQTALNNFQIRNQDPFNTIASTVVSLPKIPGPPQNDDKNKSVYVVDNQINNYIV